MTIHEKWNAAYRGMWRTTYAVLVMGTAVFGVGFLGTNTLLLSFGGAVFLAGIAMGAVNLRTRREWEKLGGKVND